MGAELEGQSLLGMGRERRRPRVLATRNLLGAGLVGGPSYLTKVLSRKQRLRSRPAQSWTPTMPKMKKTKKHSRSTFPSMGRVSSSNVTRIRMPVGGRTSVSIGTSWGIPWAPSPSCEASCHSQMGRAALQGMCTRTLRVQQAPRDNDISGPGPHQAKQGCQPGGSQGRLNPPCFECREPCPCLIQALEGLAESPAAPAPSWEQQLWGLQADWALVMGGAAWNPRQAARFPEAVLKPITRCCVLHECKLFQGVPS